MIACWSFGESPAPRGWLLAWGATSGRPGLGRTTSRIAGLVREAAQREAPLRQVTEQPEARGATDGAEEDESVLVRQAKNGEMAAFEALYRRHVGRIHALCLRMTSDRSAAEEQTQDVFVRAWERLESFRGDAAFGTWLYRIAVNQVVGAMRDRRRMTDRLRDLFELGETPPTAPAGAAIDLEAAVRTLAPGARLVFLLHDVEGYKHAEIAEMTGIAEGTSKAHLHAARKRLRKALDG